MTGSDLVALLPWLVLAAGSLVLMLVIAFRRDHPLAAGVALATLGLALLSLPLAASATPRDVTPLFRVDGYALLFTALMVAATAAVILLSYGYNRGRPEYLEEYYLLLLLAVLGASLLAASSHLVSFFLCEELLSVCLDTRIGYLRLLQGTFFGPNERRWKIPDLGLRELGILAALIALVLWLGLYPQPFLDTAAPALEALRQQATGGAASEVMPGDELPTLLGLGREAERP